MSRPGFYNDNLGRWYPFLPPSEEDELSARLPRSAIADAFAVISSRARFDHASGDRVVLREVSRRGPMIYFVFRVVYTPRGDVAPLAGSLHRTVVLFCRHVDDQLYAADYRSSKGEASLEELASLPSASFSFPEEQGASEPMWYMHLVSGDMQQLAGELPMGSTWTGELTLMPTRVLSLAGQTVTRLRVANMPRTMATAPDGCRPYCWPVPAPLIWQQSDILGGDLVVENGVQSSVGLDSVGRQLLLHAAPDAGDCRPCGEWRVDPREAPPVGGRTLSGGPLCEETIRSINGVGGPVITLHGGAGVHIASQPSRHRIVITVRRAGGGHCAPGFETPEDPRPDTYSSDPCDCGPA